jgi:hypothetical protein
MKASASFKFNEPLQAELKIAGNPREEFCFVKNTRGNNRVAIVVLNPFHLMGGGDKDCPDWLAEPLCNNYLSNKQWLVNGVNHNITQGSYVTTLHVEITTARLKSVSGLTFKPPAAKEE